METITSAANQLTVAGLSVQLFSVFLMWRTIRVDDREVEELAIGSLFEANRRIFGVRYATARAAIYKQYVAFLGFTVLLLGVVIQLIGVALAQFKHPGLPLWIFLLVLLALAFVVFPGASRLANYNYRKRVKSAIQARFDQWQQEGVQFTSADVSDVSTEIRTLLADVCCDEQIKHLIDTQMKRVCPP